MTVKVLWLILFLVNFSYGYGVDVKVLNVGDELFEETLPLRMGSRYYQLQGLKPNTWYEVKISYPASIPAVFSLELKKDISGVGVRRLRKLLNTEKLIFKAENLDEISHLGGSYVLIAVEPEGVVALRGVRDRENILFNIVCDELVMGIPREAWLVVAFGVACIVAGCLVPLFLPSFLLPKDDENLKHVTQLLADKDS
ncbi:uncharacterized protein LOC141612146 [Silene latifolia]|uniref:uncharacterized protein LOC141612146 n=1 Tax=Silene latifolia TaxID=37657 RepID=UPI003D786F3C